jgi:hypothetical protein
MSRHPRPEVVPAVLVTLGLLLSGGCGSSDSGGHPAGTSPSASTSSDPSESETSGDAPQHLIEGPTTPLAAGAYQFSVLANPGVEVPDAVVEVPSGFDDEAAWYIVSPDQQEFLGLWAVGLVDRDACLHGEQDAFDPGPSVEDLADALVAQKSTRATAPQPVTLAGHEGVYVELASPRDISTCTKYPGLWREPERGIYNDGQVDLVWILDVDGQRLVVNAAYTPKSTASDIDKLTSMVESLEFDEAAHP